MIYNNDNFVYTFLAESPSSDGLYMFNIATITSGVAILFLLTIVVSFAVRRRKRTSCCYGKHYIYGTYLIIFVSFVMISITIDLYVIKVSAYCMFVYCVYVCMGTFKQ